MATILLNLSICSFAVIAQSSVEVAFARSTVWISKVSFSTRVAVWCLKFNTTFTVTRFFSAISS